MLRLIGVAALLCGGFVLKDKACAVVADVSATVSGWTKSANANSTSSNNEAPWMADSLKAIAKDDESVKKLEAEEDGLWEDISTQKRVGWNRNSPTDRACENVLVQTALPIYAAVESDRQRAIAEREQKRNHLEIDVLRTAEGLKSDPAESE